MKKLILAVLLFSSPLLAQQGFDQTSHSPTDLFSASGWVSNGAATIPTTTVAGLALLSPSVGWQRIVTDGATAVDCAVGGGSDKVDCIYNGTSWQPVAGSGSGSVTTFTTGGLSPLFSCSVTNASTTPDLACTPASVSAHNFFGNNTGSSAAGNFFQPAFTDLSGSASTAQITTPLASLNGIFYATNYSGTDAIDKINQCATDAAAAGGICFATGISGAQTVSTVLNPPANAVIYFGNAQFSYSTLPMITLNVSDTLIGASFHPGGTSKGTQFLYTGTAAAGEEAGLRCTTALSCTNDHVSNIHIRHTGATAADGSYGVQIWNINNSTFTSVYVTGFERGWSGDGVSGGSYYNTFIDIMGQSDYYYDYYVIPNVNQNKFIHPLCNSGARATETCYYMHGVGNTWDTPQAETGGGGTTGFDVGSSFSTIINPYGEGNTTPGVIQSNANLTTIFGGNVCFTDNSAYWKNNISIAPGCQVTASPTSSFGGFPNFWKSNIYQLGNSGPKLELFGGSTAAWTGFQSITSISRTSNVVSVTLFGGYLFTPTVGDQVEIAGTSPGGATSFNGTFTIASVTDATHFTYNQTAADDTATGGWAVTIARGPASRPIDVSLIFPNQTVTAGSCTTPATIPMPGLSPSGVLFWGTSYDLSGAAGWGTTQGLKLFLWPTTNTVNWRVCNTTGSDITSPTVTFEIAAK